MPEVAHTLRGEGFDASEDGTGRGTPIVPVAFGGGNRSGPVEVAATLTAKGNRQDFEVETFVAQPVAFNPKTALAPHGSGATSEVAYPLTATGHKDQQMVAQPVVEPIAFAMRGREEGNVPEVEGDGQTTGALRAASGGSTNPHVALAVPILEVGKRTGVSTTDKRAGLGIGDDGDPMFTLQAAAQHGVGTEYAVRRLTPDECARLQGFPDGHSRISWKGKPPEECPDGPQYKTYGNSMAVAVIRWIATRMDADARRG